MKLLFSNAAKADLLQIGDYIAEVDPARAVKLVRNLRDRCAGLATTPLAHPLVPRFSHLGIRKRVAGNYLLFYRVDAQYVTMVRIMHSARDYEDLLDP